jgi:hypothetical protein
MIRLRNTALNSQHVKRKFLLILSELISMIQINYAASAKNGQASPLTKIIFLCPFKAETNNKQ